jgi:hypothetical protein
MIRIVSILCAMGLLLAAPAAWANGSGDCDGNGVVDAADVDCARAAVGTKSGDDGFVAAADTDGDGVVSLADLSDILQASK